MTPMGRNLREAVHTNLLDRNVLSAHIEAQQINANGCICDAEVVSRKLQQLNRSKE